MCAVLWKTKQSMRHLIGKSTLAYGCSPLNPSAIAIAEEELWGWFTHGAFFRGIAENRLQSRLFERTGVNVLGKGNLLTGKLKWRYLTAGYVKGGAEVGDLDGDGIKEAVFGSLDYKVYCVKPDGTIKWTYATGGDCHATNITIFDINGDGKLEALICSGDAKLHCLNSDGSFNWSYTTGGGCGDSNPVVYDIDNDGALEIVFCSDDGKVYCLNPDGTPKWTYDLAVTPGGKLLTIGDIDEDGIVELLFGCEGDFYLYCLRGDDHSLKWRTLLGGVPLAPALADVNGDQKLEIVTCSEDDGSMNCLKNDGTLLWTEQLVVPPAWCINLHVGMYDIDKDGVVEIMAGDGEGFYMNCLKHTAPRLKWRYATGNNVINSAVLADVDNDGLYEVLFGGQDQYIYCLESDGTLKWRYLTGGRLTYHALSVDDLDGDGLVEVFAGSNDCYQYCLTSD